MTKEVTKKKAGRPSLAKSDGWEQIKDIIYRYAELGATHGEIAKLLNVTEMTLGNWRKQDPDFFIHLEGAKDRATRKVEDNLYKIASGEKKIKKKKTIKKDGVDATGNVVNVIEEHEEEIEVLPSEGVLKMYLKARDKKYDDRAEQPPPDIKIIFQDGLDANNNKG